MNIFQIQQTTIFYVYSIYVDDMSENFPLKHWKAITNSITCLEIAITIIIGFYFSDKALEMEKSTNLAILH